MDAKDIMRTTVETVGPDDDVSDVLGRLANVDFNGFPVVDDDGHVVGIVTQHDVVSLFQTKDRTLWIPVGFPPFMETLTYAVDVSWKDLDLGVDAVRSAGKPVRDVMTTDVVTVAPDDDFDHVLDLLADDERDINRLPVVDDGGVLVGIIARQDVLRALRDERRAA
ncbi:cbs-domain-containing membrane protein [Halogranum salarium B-1]|uniref:Cbs-domain-containing membrane protein n=2 Tax=Halogranum rubrum TaxID=553466 RepID=J3JFJ5_9EURY|nr:cbs-domain-containing membrane protein [Halogranum salarium B-1]